MLLRRTRQPAIHALFGSPLPRFDFSIEKPKKIFKFQCFADREKKRKMLEERANEENRRMAETAQKVCAKWKFEIKIQTFQAVEKRQLEEEYKKNYEESRDERRGSWRDFMKKKEKKLEKFRGANFKPPVPKLEVSKEPAKNAKAIWVSD